MKSLVITGCFGFIGSHVTRLCLLRGYKVYGVDKLTYASVDIKSEIAQEILNNRNFTFEQTDIADLKRLPDCDYVINIAAESHVGNSIINCSDFVHSNIDGVRNLLTLIEKKPNNVRKRPILLHFSSDEVYGDIENGSFNEESKLNPSNPYAVSKAAADMLIKSWHRTYGIDYIIVRPTNNYGRYQYPEKLVPLSVKLLMDSHKIRLHDEGKPIRTWLHVEDTADAILCLLKRGKTNNIYNIGGKEELQNIEVATMIVNSFLKKKGVELSEELAAKYFDLDYKREGQDVRYSVDDSKLRNLGWQPIRSFEEEILDIVEHYKNNYRW